MGSRNGSVVLNAGVPSRGERLPLALHSLVLLVAATLCGCGESAAPAPAPAGHFQRCRLQGLPAPCAVAVAGGDLLLACGENHRTIYAVERRLLRAEQTLAARAVELAVREAAHISGGDRLAVQGYQVRHLWELPLDLVAIAVQDPSFFFLGDRRFRVVYWGRIVRDAAGRTQRLQLDYAFVPPGADRAMARGGDWEDKSRALGGLLAVNHAGMTEDLYLAERGQGVPGRFRVWRLDRFGTPLGNFEVGTGAEVEPQCLALAHDANRFLTLHGEGGGALAPFTDPGEKRRVVLGKPTPTPALPGGVWTSMASAPDGTLYLVGRDGEGVVLAWRAP